MSENNTFTIAIPIGWNEMITTDSHSKGKNFDLRYLTMPFFNITPEEETLNIKKDENSIYLQKSELVNLFTESIKLFSEEIAQGTLKAKFYKKSAKASLDMLKLINGDLLLKFDLYKSERLISALLPSHSCSIRTKSAYLLNMFDIFDKINISTLKNKNKHLRNYLPLAELEKKGLLKDINPVIKKEFGCLDSRDGDYAELISLQGWRNSSGVCILASEESSYSSALDDYLEMKFGDSSKIKTKQKNEIFKKSLSKEFLIKKHKLDKKITTSKYIVHTNDEDTAAVFYKKTNHCKILKEMYSKNKMRVSYYAKNGYLMCQYFIKINNKDDVRKMREPAFRLTDNEDGVSTIFFKKNKPYKHIVRFYNKSNKFSNSTISLLKMFNKYNSSDSLIITDPMEIEIIKIMKNAKISVIEMSKLLDKYNLEEKNKISEDTISLIMMKHST